MGNHTLFLVLQFTTQFYRQAFCGMYKIIEGLDQALSHANTQLRIFGKPDARMYRRMGVALARACGVPDRVCHIIAAHAGEGDMVTRTPEAYVVHHADFMTFLPFKHRFE